MIDELKLSSLTERYLHPPVAFELIIVRFGASSQYDLKKNTNLGVSIGADESG
ncbi:hypothetical protein EJB05_14306 [Eragrostis curvula]|uniref:Uncharacterized protein n=1 Tax=Eragrostis curvula TaxID=38414 RepID=A0A5J9VYX4_9POAL|nr:hypothetical protein EJB05_14306 [Eragrostis curvula]